MATDPATKAWEVSHVGIVYIRSGGRVVGDVESEYLVSTR